MNIKDTKDLTDNLPCIGLARQAGQPVVERAEIEFFKPFSQGSETERQLIYVVGITSEGRIEPALVFSTEAQAGGLYSLLNAGRLHCKALDEIVGYVKMSPSRNRGK
ncbi:MAG: hypothetical protein WC852_06065 [Candidatus Nanoarchaeia archaeon]|jgi:hypothetical protein